MYRLAARIAFYETNPLNSYILNKITLYVTSDTRYMRPEKCPSYMPRTPPLLISKGRRLNLILLSRLGIIIVVREQKITLK